MSLRNSGGIIVIGAILAFGAWISSDKTQFESECVQHFDTYMEVSLRFIGKASNVPPEHQLEFSRDLDEFAVQIGNCPNEQKAVLRSVSEIYISSLFSLADDMILAVENSHSSGQNPEFTPSNKTQELFDQLRKRGVSEEMIDFMSSSTEAFEVVFHNYPLMPEPKKKLIRTQMKSIMDESSRRTAGAFDQLYPP